MVKGRQCIRQSNVPLEAGQVRQREAAGGSCQVMPEVVSGKNSRGRLHSPPSPYLGLPRLKGGPLLSDVFEGPSVASSSVP